MSNPIKDIFMRLRQNRFLRLVYRFPGAADAYHFLLAFLGAAIYGFPSRNLKVVGITGTKGKSTSASLTSALLEAGGRKTALLSSVWIKTGGGDAERNESGNSMPGRAFIQKFLRRAVRAGSTHAVIEVTSQGIAMHRHRFIRYAAAGITNIAPEHIEAHGSFEKYRASKLAFLAYAARGGTPVFINSDDAPSVYFEENLPRAKIALYSVKDLKPLSPAVKESLPGKFNKENVALAAAIARRMGVAENEIERGLASFDGVPGRAEFVRREPFAVVVDYAHTPESLKAVYEMVRDSGARRIIGVLGAAGGGRDAWKRPAMGKIAAALSDELILTNEDPYDEDPEAILDQIASGFPRKPGDKKTAVKYEKILDRKAAIRAAIRRARPGDAVLITGKGSELSMHLAKGEVVEWNDRVLAEEALGI